MRSGAVVLNFLSACLSTEIFAIPNHACTVNFGMTKYPPSNHRKLGKARRAAESTGLGTARVMTWDDLKKTRAEQAAKET